MVVKNFLLDMQYLCTQKCWTDRNGIALFVFFSFVCLILGMIVSVLYKCEMQIALEKSQSKCEYLCVGKSLSRFILFFFLFHIVKRAIAASVSFVLVAIIHIIFIRIESTIQSRNIKPFTSLKLTQTQCSI